MIDSNNNRIYLSPPHMGGSELNYIHQAFSTNWISTVGPQINAFEESLEKYCNVEKAAVLSSGTSAIHLALRLLGVGPGDAVICQSFTFAGTVNPVLYQGAKPIFIDSEPGTWNMDPVLLEESINKLKAQGSKLKAIIPVHLYGMPYNVSAIHDVAARYNIPIIEDAAEALGSTYQNKTCGSFGDFGILSFNGNKIITTSGGGALLSNKGEWIDKAKFLATQARDPAPHYEHTTYGYNYRMGNINAAIGLGQMEVLDQRVERRREIYNSYYKEQLSEFKNISFLDEPQGSFSNRWLTCIQTDSYETREKLRLVLEKENIESRPLWKPMHLQPVFKDAQCFGGSVAEGLFEKGLCLPSGSSMSDADLERVIGVVKKTFGAPQPPKGGVQPLGYKSEERGVSPSGDRGAAQENKMHYYANPATFRNAQDLRHSETPAEQLLWSYLKKNQLGVKFRRQHPIGHYIADFYCHPARLVIELDGGYHNSQEQKTYDVSRDNSLKELGLSVLRFENHEVFDDIKNVLNRIKKRI